MIKVNNENRKDIIRSYAHTLLDSMDFDTIYSFAYEQLVISKDSMNNESLEQEVREYCPEILED